MFRPISAMITMASNKLMPGISASRCAAASTCESGLVPAGPVSPVASTPQDSSTWASAAMAWSSMAVICWSKNATWSSSTLRDHAVVGVEHAIQRLGEGVPLAAKRPLGQTGERARVAFPGDQRLHHRHWRLGLHPVRHHRGDLEAFYWQSTTGSFRRSRSMPHAGRSAEADLRAAARRNLPVQHRTSVALRPGPPCGPANRSYRAVVRRHGWTASNNVRSSENMASSAVAAASRVRSRTRSCRARVKSRTARIAAGGTKLGRSMPHWVSRASHIASSLSVFGRPLQVPRLRRGHQLHRQPGAFQHVIPDTPVIRGALQRYHLHPVAQQFPAHLGDPRPGRWHVIPDPVDVPARTLRVRGPQAHHPGRLGHVHRGHPLIDDFVILIRDHLRLAHRTLLC